MVTMIQERYIKPGKHEELRAIQRELRQAAMNHSGFITGEALINVNNPNHQVVTANWQTLEDWRTWERDKVHQDLARKMRPLLTRPPRNTICGPFAI